MAAGTAGVLLLWWLLRGTSSSPIVLYGNLDLRQVELAFNNSERISEVFVDEGARVSRGQLLAKLDSSRLSAQAALAESQAAAQRDVVERLHNGSRPEEIAQARASVESAQADAVYAKQQLDRLKTIAAKMERAVSQQDLNAAEAALRVAEAKLSASQKALDLQLAGPRREDIAQGEAQLRAAEAQVQFVQQQLADAELHAPADAIVRSRLLEPGEMVTPQKAVYSLALLDPKWVRAYVEETDLGRVHPGQQASIMVDTFPDRRFEGWVGFISPVAEFTPKAVQTEKLRTSLVYEVRIFVKDPADELRLGMPATVYLSALNK